MEKIKLKILESTSEFYKWIIGTKINKKVWKFFDLLLKEKVKILF